MNGCTRAGPSRAVHRGRRAPWWLTPHLPQPGGAVGRRGLRRPRSQQLLRTACFTDSPGESSKLLREAQTLAQRTKQEGPELGGDLSLLNPEADSWPWPPPRTPHPMLCPSLARRGTPLGIKVSRTCGTVSFAHASTQAPCLAPPPQPPPPTHASLGKPPSQSRTEPGSNSSPTGLPEAPFPL